MRKLLAILGLTCFALVSQAADIITATITVTNTAGTTNGQTILVNGNTRTWTNSVVVPAAQILTNSTIGGAATNLFNQVSANQFTGPTLDLKRSGTNGIQLQAPPGGALAVTLSAGWGDVVLTTNTTASGTVVRVPYTGDGAAQQTNITSGVVAMLNAAPNTNIIYENALSVSRLVGITNNQTITGIKNFSNSISGNVGVFTNGTYLTPTLSNTVELADMLVTGDLQVNSNLAFFGFASTIHADGNGLIFSPEGGSDVRLGQVGGVNGLRIRDGVFTNSVSITNNLYAGGTTLTNLTMLGSSTFANMNNFPAGADIGFGRFPITSLATGNNAAVPVGTNVFVEVSGPGAAFTINGIAGGRDGKFLIILNQTTFAMTIAHESGTDPTPANRIITMDGANQSTTGNGAAMLIYSGTASRWILLSLAQ